MRRTSIVCLVTAATAFAAAGASAQESPRPGATSSQESQPAPAPTTRHVKKPKKEPVPHAVQETDTAADKANRAVVGNAQQNANQTGAANPSNGRPPTPREERERREDAEKVGKTTTTAANVVSRDVRDVTAATEKGGGRYNPFAIEYNPLGLFVGGRVSFNLEWVPATHHAIEVSPHFIHTSADVATTGDNTVSQTFTGAGAELGYRYYTGHRGPNGVFIGPSLILGAYNAGLPSGNQAFTDVGIAGDVGVQWIFFDHLVVGGGVGIEYLSVSHDFHDLPTGPSAIASTGVKPRAILEAGYGF